MTSSQLQWAAISGAAVLGLGLLIYDMQNRKLETTEATNVKLKIEEVRQNIMIPNRKSLTSMSSGITPSKVSVAFASRQARLVRRASKMTARFACRRYIATLKPRRLRNGKQCTAASTCK